MCGRFVSTTRPEDLVDHFGIQQWDPTETLAPSWNVAPTESAFAVLDRAPKGEREPVRQLRVLRWGLVPAWSRSADTAVKMINARADTVHEKPAYRQAFASRRCLLPVDGYYEWQTLPAEGRGRPRKQPYFVSRVDGAPLALAGLYEFWRDRALPPDHPDAWLVTCTVVTTDAEPMLAPIHERMPLFLDPSRFDAWLDPALDEPEEVRRLLVPPAPGELRAHPVGAAVGNIRNNGPELVRELNDEDRTTLF
ncbi:MULTISPECIES: SOS response-associated peptidase [Kitasatospora]|uniref:Abasic site processing protein n=2 Tax=Kitasatospora TaxID=2063 RepID=A0ABT1IQW5_9ACTN|nr:SOS response-associated peptidase [Kitasatospora paracochleata]MCP2307497.1 putative SOS response-associated peptidase YedK [Kitasatospora paracochleata]